MNGALCYGELGVWFFERGVIMRESFGELPWFGGLAMLSLAELREGGEYHHPKI